MPKSAKLREKALCERLKARVDDKSAFSSEQKCIEFARDVRKDLDELVAVQRESPRELILDGTELKSDIDAVQSDEFDESDEAWENRLDNLTFWLLEKAPDCFIGDRFEFTSSSAEGRGVVAAKDLKAGEHCISIPRELVMSTTTARASKVGEMMRNDPMCLNMPNVLLSLHLLYERLTPKSPWRAYIDALPRNFSLPVMFTAEEFECMRGSPTLGQAVNLLKSQVMHYLYFQKIFKASNNSLPQFRFEDYRWAMAVVMSRQNRIPVKGCDDEFPQYDLVLIPAMDMCNYADGNKELTTYFKDERSETFTFEDVPKGKQIYMYYGDRPNSALFLHMGFVSPTHPADTYIFPIDALDEADPLFKLKKLLLTKCELNTKIQLLISNNGKLPGEFIRYCRLATITKEESLAFMKKKDPKAAVSDANEQKACALMVDMIIGALGMYRQWNTAKTNAIAAGEDASASANTRLVAQLIQTERTILGKLLITVEKYAALMAKRTVN